MGVSFDYHTAPDPDNEQGSADHLFVTLVEFPAEVSGSVFDATTKTFWAEFGVGVALPAGTTYRYRPGCRCGWKGPLVDARKDPKWYYQQVVDPNFTGLGPDEFSSELVEVWRVHYDQAVAAAVGLDAITEAIKTLEAAEDDVYRAVINARTAGRSWAQIAVRLGITRQSAWETYRTLDPNDS